MPLLSIHVTLHRQPRMLELCYEKESQRQTREWKMCRQHKRNDNKTTLHKPAGRYYNDQIGWDFTASLRWWWVFEFTNLHHIRWILCTIYELFFMGEHEHTITISVKRARYIHLPLIDYWHARKLLKFIDENPFIHSECGIILYYWHHPHQSRLYTYA